MKQVTVAGIILLCAGVAGCGRSAPDVAQAAPESSGAPSTGSSAQPERRGAAAVDFTQLMSVIPDLSGWTRSQPRGEQVMSGVAISTADAEYLNGDSIIKLSITDSAFSPLVLAPLEMVLKPKYSERSGESYRKYVSIDGQPGCESWQNDARDGDITILVSGRFVVNARGLNLSSIEPLQKLVKAIPIKRLAALK